MIFSDEKLCEHCLEQTADIFADGEWLCPDCEYEAANEQPLISGLELASIYWGCTAKIIQGGQT
jgi:hypothetical protein